MGERICEDLYYRLRAGNPNRNDNLSWIIRNSWETTYSINHLKIMIDYVELVDELVASGSWINHQHFEGYQ